MYRKDELAHYGVKGMEWGVHKVSEYEAQQELKRKKRASSLSAVYRRRGKNSIDFSKLGLEKKSPKKVVVSDQKSSDSETKTDDKKVKAELTGQLVTTSSKTSTVSDVKKKNSEAYLEAEHRVESALSKKTFGKGTDDKKSKSPDSLGSDQHVSSFGKVMDDKKKKKTTASVKSMSIKK